MPVHKLRMQHCRFHDEKLRPLAIAENNQGIAEYHARCRAAQAPAEAFQCKSRFAMKQSTIYDEEAHSVRIFRNHRASACERECVG
jgi:hypothetical protein